MTIFEALDKHGFEYFFQDTDTTKELNEDLFAEVLWYQYSEDDKEIHFKISLNPIEEIDEPEVIIEECFIDAEEFDEYMNSFEIPKPKFKLNVDFDVLGYSKKDVLNKLKDQLYDVQFDYRINPNSKDKAITITEI